MFKKLLNVSEFDILFRIKSFSSVDSIALKVPERAFLVSRYPKKTKVVSTTRIDKKLLHMCPKEKQMFRLLELENTAVSKQFLWRIHN